jgi:hypothetical protein
MKTYVIAAIGMVAILAAVGLVSAGYGSGACEKQKNKNFIDVDGDGICDNWVDEDGDGMNDLRPLDGTGNQYKYGAKHMKGSGYGPRDGTGHKGLGPRDGTGFGPGTGDCVND